MGRRRKAYIMKLWGVKVGELPRREERNKGLGGGLVWWGRAFGVAHYLLYMWKPWF
jgi:hypothetical protein